MRYLISVIDTGPHISTSEEMNAIDAFNDKIQSAGQRVLACGLHLPATALTIDARSDEVLISEGPVNNTQEFMSGFWIVDVDSAETAKQLAIEGSRACQLKVELRQLHG